MSFFPGFLKGNMWQLHWSATGNGAEAHGGGTETTAGPGSAHRAPPSPEPPIPGPTHGPETSGFQEGMPPLAMFVLLGRIKGTSPNQVTYSSF